MDLIFRDLDVSIGNAKILKGISGIVEQGSMLAVMGASGAGKTTLLNCLAGRIPADSGEVLVNNQPMNKQIRRKMCYVLQQDVFFANLTLRQTLRFQALLRCPESMPHKKKIQRVEEVVAALNLEKCLDTVMGSVLIRGLSGGEKKRANIACELLTNPNLMLLDEPTSGLDSSTALTLMQTLKGYTEKSGKTVVTTIHQPSSQIFYMFNQLLLLCNGQVAYFGETSGLMRFFASLGMHCERHYNPADFMLEKIKEGKETQEKIITAATKEMALVTFPSKESNGHGSNGYVSKQANRKLISNRNLQENGGVINLAYRELDVDKKNGFSHTAEIRVDIMNHMVEENTTYYKELNNKWPTSFLSQYKTLTMRNFHLSKARLLDFRVILQWLVMALLAGGLWFQIPFIEENLQNILGSSFFVIIYCALNPIGDAVTSFSAERGVINKERLTGSYRISAYYFAKMTSDLPLVIIPSLIFVIIVYMMAGFYNGSALFATLGSLTLTVLVSQSIGFLIGVLVLDVKLSLICMMVSFLGSVLAGGFYITSIPLWLDWIKYLSFMYHAYNTLIIYQFSNAEPLRCHAESALSVFPACKINGTTHVAAEEVLRVRGITFPAWAHLLSLVAFIVLLRTLAYVVLRFVRKPHMGS